MGLNVGISHDCTLVTVSSKSYINGSSGEIQVTNYDSGGVMSPNKIINFTGTNGVGRINIPISDMPGSNGLFKICLIENGTEQACKPLLVHCDVDCCITKLTNQLLDCACDCPKCATVLAKAQKYFYYYNQLYLQFLLLPQAMELGMKGIM